jgi:hypothetical protein
MGTANETTEIRRRCSRVPTLVGFCLLLLQNPAASRYSATPCGNYLSADQYPKASCFDLGDRLLKLVVTTALPQKMKQWPAPGPSLTK